MRLLFVPQYPSKLRYQEWWFTEFPKQMSNYFDEVVTIEGFDGDLSRANPGDFSPIEAAIEWECEQIKQYMEIDLKPNDVMFISDLSFPGLFPNVLHHKKPKKVYMFCHGTSKNFLDYFERTYKSKFAIETAHANLSDVVFVGSHYHRQKLGWKNITVQRLPYPPMVGYYHLPKTIDIISVSRPTDQKVNLDLENHVERILKLKIERSKEWNNWDEYYHFVGSAKVMLITAKEETFGYQIVDAIMNNCIPIAPYKFSYPELLPREYLYKDEGELFFLLGDIFHGGKELPVPELKCNEQMIRFYENLANKMRW